MQSASGNHPAKQITSKQHIFPQSGLRRFANPLRNRLIHVLTVETEVRAWLGVNAAPFIANRAWDQRTEHGETAASVERHFGMVAKNILSGKVRALDSKANADISRMFSLWRTRHHFVSNPAPDMHVGIPERCITNEAMDQGEHYGIISIAPDGRIPARMRTGPPMQQAYARMSEEMAGKRWGIVHAQEGEFVLPDSFGEFMVLPLSPTYCLIADEHDGTLGSEGVKHLNATARANATAYLFARDLDACPGV